MLAGPVRLVRRERDNLPPQRRRHPGIKNRCDLVGPSKTMVEAPTHFGDSATENPKDYYGRFGVIYGYNATTGARLIGAVAFGATGVTATEDNIQQYWNN